MKVLFYGFVLFAMTSSAFASDNVFIAKHFSIIIPEGMTFDEKSDDKISLIFQGDEGLQNGTLSVQARESDNLLRTPNPKHGSTIMDPHDVIHKFHSTFPLFRGWIENTSEEHQARKKRGRGSLLPENRMTLRFGKNTTRNRGEWK
jgi:hypothetical protein